MDKNAENPAQQGEQSEHELQLQNQRRENFTTVANSWAKSFRAPQETTMAKYYAIFFMEKQAGGGLTGSHPKPSVAMMEVSHEFPQPADRTKNMNHLRAFLMYTLGREVRNLNMLVQAVEKYEFESLLRNRAEAFKWDEKMMMNEWAKVKLRRISDYINKNRIKLDYLKAPELEYSPHGECVAMPKEEEDLVFDMSEFFKECFWPHGGPPDGKAYAS